MACLIFQPHRANLICSACSDFTDQPHVDEKAVFCARCCPNCAPKPPAERTGPVVGLGGVQGGLFS